MVCTFCAALQYIYVLHSRLVVYCNAGEATCQRRVGFGRRCWKPPLFHCWWSVFPSLVLVVRTSLPRPPSRSGVLGAPRCLWPLGALSPRWEGWLPPEPPLPAGPFGIELCEADIKSRELPKLDCSRLETREPGGVVAAAVTTNDAAPRHGKARVQLLAWKTELVGGRWRQEQQNASTRRAPPHPGRSAAPRRFSRWHRPSSRPSRRMARS